MSDDRDTTPPTDAGGGSLPGGVPQPCPPSVTIDGVIRGNPHTSSGAVAVGLPDSVPPSKTYSVEVTVTNPNGQPIDLDIANSGGSNGTATVSPQQITTTTTVTVTGGAQTAPGNGGNLKIRARQSGAVLAESAGFTVCAHPASVSTSRHGDIGTAVYVGVKAANVTHSDSGQIPDLDEVDRSEIIGEGARTNPPFTLGGSNVSGFVRADRTYVDSHGYPRGSITTGPSGSVTFTQLFVFNCKRCGASDIVAPDSGFEIVHTLRNTGTSAAPTWTHKCVKSGAGVTIGTRTATAGGGSATSDDHSIP